MTPAEFRELRQSLGLSQFQLAIAVGMTVGSISRFEQGRVTISEQIARHMRLLAESRKAVAK